MSTAQRIDVAPHPPRDAHLVAEAHALGLTVIPWTVNDPIEMQRVLALGVDGMISDRPDLLRSVLQGKGIRLPAPLEAQ